MKSEELLNEAQLTYYELVDYLLQKYGAAQFDYFHTEECVSANKKVSRSSEGLLCHHIDEDKANQLSDRVSAGMCPYAWQKKDRLVYCNLLEHLLLHLKIAILRQKNPQYKKPMDALNVYIMHTGISFICKSVNDLYMKGTTVAWMKRCFEEISGNYWDYIAILKAFLEYLDSNYVGDKSQKFLQPGAKVAFQEFKPKMPVYYCEIVEVSQKNDRMLLRLPDGTTEEKSTSYAIGQFGFRDVISNITSSMSRGYQDYYETIYNDICSFQNNSITEQIVSGFNKCFRGYIAREYTQIELSPDYGSKTADEYLSKGLPMFCENKQSIEEKKLVFWKGKAFPKSISSKFYVVRIKTMFDIKEGQEPFVRYRETDLLRVPFIRPYNSEEHNLLNREWIVLETSDILNRKTGKRYSRYKNLNGNIVPATVILTLGKEDFLTFKERYNIRHLEVLDGCVFEDKD